MRSNGGRIEREESVYVSNADQIWPVFTGLQSKVKHFSINSNIIKCINVTACQQFSCFLLLFWKKKKCNGV